MTGWLGRRRRVALIAGLGLGLIGSAGALALSGPQSVVSYSSGHQTVYGVRPTAVGLPDIGESGTVGADALVGALRAYHDSGAYERDLATVDGAARAYISQRLAAARTRPRRGRPALVLDIDETSLSNYADLSVRNFDASALAVSAVAAHGVAIGPTLRLYRYAIAHRVAVFFVTGRPPGIDSITKSNLRKAGFNRGWTALYEKPVNAGVERFKSSTRAAIRRRGYDILANVGDQQSDLDGGNADRAFKLPDPFYFISD